MKVFSVLVDDGDSAGIVAVFADFAAALARAEVELAARLAADAVDADEAVPDDADMYMTGVEWSRSFDRPAGRRSCCVSQLVCVVVQSFEV